MLSIKLIVLICVVLMATQSQAKAYTQEERERLEVQKCGRELTNVLQVLCKGKFQSRNGKRSGGTSNMMHYIHSG